MLNHGRRIIYGILVCIFVILSLIVLKDIEYRYINDCLIQYVNKEESVVELCEDLLDSKNLDFLFGSCLISFKDDSWYIETKNFNTNSITKKRLNNSYLNQLNKLGISNDTNISIFKYDEESMAIVFMKYIKFSVFDLGQLWIYYGDEESFPNCPRPNSSYRMVVKFCDNLYYDYYSNLLDLFFKEPPFLKDDNFIIVE